MAQNPSSEIQVQAQPEEYRNKWAFIVGINYQDSTVVSPLRNAERDATTIGFFAEFRGSALN